ncbi:hypothetical protein [Allorhizocola rhizosphaerae]|uniref:hypothetical protein n=1 Tax=Allorhizocola rhizosphaerae TaxID=1872709 RepID=UPI000E3E9A4F|nr:hypothetical protein [Allorhizocola rhizosphaerae]
MPVLQRLGQPCGPAAPGAARPALERVVPFSFGGGAVPEHIGPFREHMESLYGPFDDPSWLERGTFVGYHEMVRVIATELAGGLAGVDLAITVDARPDCRLQSMPGSIIARLVPGEPLIVGISEQGVAGPFLALRIAFDRIAHGGSTRALILIMEQATLPPDSAPVRPSRDLAVALLVGPDGPIRLGRPQISVTRGDGPVQAHTAWPEHPCAGAWLALASHLSEGGLAEGEMVVADRDPVLPYACSVTLSRKGP